jgi:hypothetical protein
MSGSEVGTALSWASLVTGGAGVLARSGIMYGASPVTGVGGSIVSFGSEPGLPNGLLLTNEVLAQTMLPNAAGFGVSVMSQGVQSIPWARGGGNRPQLGELPIP